MNKKRIYELEEITTHSDGDYIVVDNASYEQAKKISLSNFTEKSEELKLRDERLKYYGDPNIVPSDENLFEFTILNSKEALVNTSDTNLISGDVVIPYKCNIDGNEYLVTSIKNGAFQDCENLTSINIPDSVTSISIYAFKGCENLTSINIPDSVTSIGKYAFNSCSSLTSISIPDSVTSIGDSAFTGCSSLTSITIPDSVTSISSSAFRDCRSLTSITIPDSVTSIGDYVFNYCSSLTSITIPNSVTSIGDNAFSDCRSLTSITIPDSVTSISSSAFRDCRSLTSINIPDSVTSIGEYAFNSCFNLTSITIPDSVTSIDDSAFSRCNNLTSITCAEGSVADRYAKTKGVNVEYTNEVTKGYVDTKESTENKTIIVSADSTDEQYPSAKAVVDYVAEKSEELKLRDERLKYYGDPNIVPSDENLFTFTILNSKEALVNTSDTNLISGDVVIPYKCNIDGNEYLVISIRPSAFSGCENLTSITIPNSVIGIGPYAFERCTSLTSITIPNSVTTIVNGVFSNCTSLTSITIPNRVTGIGPGAFSDCENLTSITIPNSVTDIGDYAFDSCSSELTITCAEGSVADRYAKTKGVNVEYTNEVTKGYVDTKESTENKTTILSSDSTDEQYPSALAVYNADNALVLADERLKYYGDKDIVPSDESYFTVNETGETITGLKDEGKTQTELVIPYKINGVKITELSSDTFGDSILDGNTVITKVVIPNSVTTIGYGAFFGRTSLTSVNIPNSVTSISYKAFESCTSLIKINIPNSVKNIGNYAFKNCTSLTSINIPNGVGGIAEETFADCTSLKSINISNGVTNIGNGAFIGCTSLKSIDIPSSVTSINWSAFGGCTSLKSINIPSSVTSIGNGAFYGCTSLKTINIPSSVQWFEDGAFGGCTNLTIYCEQGSCAETYAKENNIPVIYTDIKSEIINNAENISNKVTELSESSTNEEYPTAKAVTEYVENSEKETAALLKKKSIPYTTATGCPISISDHLEEESVIDCKIYGNSVQNGTPSPDNPVEIQSVGDLVTDEASEYYGKYDIPIVVNDTITHIYLDEPLRKVGDYADYIDYGNQKVVRKIKELKLESNFEYRLWIYNDILYGFALYLYDTVSECMVLSNYFKPVTDNLLPNKHDNSIYVRHLDLFIGTSDWTTTDDFKAWLSDKDVTILYPLITPIEEPISLPVLTTPKASVANVSIHTTIQPSNIALTYYKGINKVVDGIGGFWGLDLPLIKTITLEESVASIDILSKAEGIELQEFTVLLFIKALGDVVESSISNCLMCLRTIDGDNYFGYMSGYAFVKDKTSYAVWHTKLYDNKFALTDLYNGRGDGNGGGIPYLGSQGLKYATTIKHSSYTSFELDAVDNLNIFIGSSDVSKGAIIPQGSMIFLLGR